MKEDDGTPATRDLPGTLVLLQGGHQVEIRGETPTQVEGLLADCRAARANGDRLHEGIGFADIVGDDGIFIEPDAVVGLRRTTIHVNL